MRRRVISVVGALVLAAVAPSAQAAQDVPRDEPERGLVFAGLRRGAPGGKCGSLFEVTADGQAVACTHGPDPAPSGVDVRQRRGPQEVAGPGTPGVALEGTPTPPICHGDGQSGYRVHLLYARASDKPDRYGLFASSFLQWAAQVDDVFNQSAAETGGTRHIRFVHDSSCRPVVDNVVLSAAGDDSYSRTTTDLRARGYTRSDRKYLVWVDANVYCGVGDVRADDYPGVDNAHNGAVQLEGMIARVDNGCWGLSNLVEAHELTHTLGGVQASAPNATPYYHCTDDYDRMCYNDGAGVSVRVVCPSSVPSENRLDCNHDDYFHTSPAPGSYLATHWNVANSRFLTSMGTTTVTPSAAETGQAVTVAARGVLEPGGAYQVKIATTVGGCPTGVPTGASVIADAAGNLPPTSRTIPMTTTSGTRFICFAASADTSDSTAPTPITIF